MPRYLIVFESSIGLSLFDCKNVNEIGLLDPSVQKSFQDFSLFSQMVRLVSILPFPSTAVSLDTMNLMSEGQLSDFYREFLSTALPSQISKHKHGIKLGISEQKLAGAISQEFSISCVSDSTTREIIRGIRKNFEHYLDGVTEDDIKLSQLGLAHAYSRSKVKFNQHGDDNMIISAVALLTILDKDLNTFAMRLREWYSIHFPELSRLVESHQKYSHLVLTIGQREQLDRDTINQIVEDEALTDKIIVAANNSIGREIEEIDLARIVDMAKRVFDLSNYKDELLAYLHRRMHNIAPNLTSLIGERMGAQLILASGSLTNLAKAPASTVQLLGAEKALFNALKKRKNTPKYGVIFNSGPVIAAKTEDKGRTARTTANKISIAARVDVFGDDFRSGKFGSLMKDIIDERIAGNPNQKPNLEEMEAIVLEARRYEANEGAEEAKNEEYVPPAPTHKKKHRRRKSAEPAPETQTEPAPEPEQEPVPEPEQEPVPEPEQPAAAEVTKKKNRHKMRKHHSKD